MEIAQLQSEIAMVTNSLATPPLATPPPAICTLATAEPSISEELQETMETLETDSISSSNSEKLNQNQIKLMSLGELLLLRRDRGEAPI